MAIPEAGGPIELKLWVSEMIYIRGALLETIDRYEKAKTEAEEKFGENTGHVYVIALNEMRSALETLETAAPTIKRD